MSRAVLIDAVRTPIGRRNGELRNWHPVDLAAVTLNSLIERVDLDPALVEDVILGCVMQVGEQAINLARNAVLAAGWPDSVPGVTVDRQCGSSQQAVQFAAQAVMAGSNDIVVAGGVEMMTRVPMGATMADGKFGYPFGPSLSARYADSGGVISQGNAAELIAKEWGFSREELDCYALQSHQRAAAAFEQGRFEHQLVTIEGEHGELLRADEGIRATSMAELAALEPVFVANGKITAGNSSQISDGAAAVLIMSEQRAEQLGLTPRARFVDFVVAGADPRLMLTAPIPATDKLLERNALTVDDIDLFEVNEAFSSVVLAWQADCGVTDERLNVNGGAVALGHPLGCSGARLLTTLVSELERRGGGLGLQTICEGGGLANALLVSV